MSREKRKPYCRQNAPLRARYGLKHREGASTFTLPQLYACQQAPPIVLRPVAGTKRGNRHALDCKIGLPLNPNRSLAYKGRHLWAQPSTCTISGEKRLKYNVLLAHAH